MIQLAGTEAAEMARTDALLDALAGGSAGDLAAFDDPAVRLLGALVADVTGQPPLQAVPDPSAVDQSAQAPSVQEVFPELFAGAEPGADPLDVLGPLPDPPRDGAVPSRRPERADGPSPDGAADGDDGERAKDPAVVEPVDLRRRRRGGPSAIVAFGVATTLLASTGVAAAAGRLTLEHGFVPVITGEAPHRTTAGAAPGDSVAGTIKLGVPPQPDRPPRTLPRKPARPNPKGGAPDPVGGLRDGLGGLLNPRPSRKRDQRVEPPPIVRDPIGTVDDLRRQLQRGLGLPEFP
ncbi:hypothetical protein BTM25_39690 [Actinomadura rubteroloni]|uniref:Uncharacterized protein n=1 Tax=Actinomadura rubteroloni TaxID=1926885 RepID=A0A2P4UJT9_9ACTN|nr:hypothetical protein [Actinomadura rubteroloni]POM25325.1 hypothetical protein BTM25_39690 [Actinomadura rubteroloni]